MNLRAIITAAAIALLPMAASAATFMQDGDSFSIGAGGDDSQFFGAAHAGAGGAGSFTVTFTSTEDPLLAGAEATIGNIVSGQFQGLTLSWVSLVNGVLDSTPITPPVVDLQTTFVSPDNLVQNLLIEWTGSTANASFDVEVSTVPVPAGILLMGTALAGFGVMRRRKLHS